jgi:caa(3)-type oxidase subunit IV
MKLARTHLPPLIGLFLLFFFSLGSSYLPLGVGNLAIILAICLTSALLVLCFFMELRKPEILFRLAIFAGFIWLMIYFMLIFSDYGTRFPGRLLN